MKATTKDAKVKAERLSMFLFNHITEHCKVAISRGEDSTNNWIHRAEKTFGVIA